ncbi:glycosyltransferase [Parageobacillus thermoglucosidasius]|uniref:glycosyltransferase n=1 Tax=Parageobacillus thermoglucosidasius TaxID=1426 RepID=UPI0027EEAC39|nr:glycosyltransferase [Parageobacillus thermoglucosidasius]
MLESFENIVMFNGSAWGYLWDRPRAIANEISKSGKQVYFVELMPFIRQSLSAGRRINFHSVQTQKVDNINLITTPMSFPVRRPLENLLAYLNLNRGKYYCKYIMKKGYIPKKSICIIHNPLLWPMIKPIKDDFSLICYDNMDDWKGLETDVRKFGLDVEALENDLVENSHIVFSVSSILDERMKQKNNNSHLIPNGVDFDRFAQLEGKLSILREEYRKPIIGFIGTIAEWIDLSLIEKVAKEILNATVLLVGPIHEDVTSLEKLPNVKFLGKVKYDEVPSYINLFDVCLNPFKKTDAGNAADPIKLYEYLALGKPVVSTNIPEAIKLKDVIYIADDEKEFVDKVKHALNYQTHEEVSRRKEIAKKNSWRKRSEDILSIIKDTLEGRL